MDLLRAPFLPAAFLAALPPLRALLLFFAADFLELLPAAFFAAAFLAGAFLAAAYFAGAFFGVDAGGMAAGAP